jgi:hypothetical protein
VAKVKRQWWQGGTLPARHSSTMFNEIFNDKSHLHIAVIKGQGLLEVL